MSEPEHSIVILPSVIRLLGTCSGNLKEEARLLTPPGCCMWVAPLLQARNLLLRHGKEEETKQRTGPVVYFWRITSTNGDSTAGQLS